MKTEPSKKMAVLLGQELDVSLQIRWAVSLAKARKLDLIVYHVFESQEDRVAEVSFNEPGKEKVNIVIKKVQHALKDHTNVILDLHQGADSVQQEEEIDNDDVHVCMKIIYSNDLSSLRKSLLAEIVKNKIVLFTLAREKTFDKDDAELTMERRLFLRHIPCEIVICCGLKKGMKLSNILVATQPGPNDRAALRLGNDLADSLHGSITALHVNPNIGPDSELVGKRRLDRHLMKTFGTKLPTINRKVVVDDKVQSAVRFAWKAGHYDLIVVGTSWIQIESSVVQRLGKDIPVVLVTAASPIFNRFRAFFEEKIHQFVPQIERDERISLVDRVQSSASWTFDFLALMVLSTTMAAVGLVQNSAAVVIGAMLVAPLMTPLLGLGLALVQGNPVLARLSFRSVILGVCVSLLGGFMVGLFTLGFEEPTREMLARGGPGILDLIVAFAAGLAAAYASSRASLIAALPGVAIAAALVPPIATSGLALSLADFQLAFGALLLFCINMVTITLAAMVSLWLVGMRNLKKMSRWIVASGSIIIAAVLVLGIYLSLQPHEYELTREIPKGLIESVKKNLGTAYSFDSLAVAYDELGVQMNIQVAGNKPAPEELATVVRILVSDHYEQPVRIRLLTRIDLDHD
jgi:uncharacterized hydrophobic protein (TIGR00271 family)